MLRLHDSQKKICERAREILKKEEKSPVEMSKIFMNDPKINDEYINQENQVIIWKSPEPAAYPESPHRFYAKRIRLFKYPDQHPSNQEAA